MSSRNVQQGRSRSRSRDRYNDKERDHRRGDVSLRKGDGSDRHRDRRQIDTDRRRSRSRSRSRSPPRRRSPPTATRHRSRSRDAAPPPPKRGRSRSRSHSPDRDRHSRKDRPRSRSREKRKRSRSRSLSSSGGSSSDSERERRRKKKEKHKKRRSRSRERKKDKKKDKKSKKKHKSVVSSQQWGKYGIISEADIFTKEQEFRAWLVEERVINPETISKEQSKKEFARFAEDYNTATLPHEKFYNMEIYEKRMDALRSGADLPLDDGKYDPNADLKALQSTHKRRPPTESETYLNKEQLMELRKVQAERIEAGKMKLLGMEVKQNMGVRMDGTSFDT